MSRREADLRNRLDNDQATDGTAGVTEDDDASPVAEGEEPPVDEDYQLARALDLLRGVAMFSGRTIE
jgi:carboxyl-terminal processing protease